MITITAATKAANSYRVFTSSILSQVLYALAYLVRMTTLCGTTIIPIFQMEHQGSEAKEPAGSHPTYKWLGKI